MAKQKFIDFCPGPNLGRGQAGTVKNPIKNLIGKDMLARADNTTVALHTVFFVKVNHVTFFRNIKEPSLSPGG